MSDPRLSLLLSLADDELILGHRLSEWTGWVPYLEADLALSSIAQDELGHARALYGIAVNAGWATDEDALALGRTPGEYRNALICERPNVDYAFTLARQWLYDAADRVRCVSLEASSWTDLANLLRTVHLEEDYHLAHATTWIRRLADGPIDARHRLAAAVAAVLPDAIAIFEPLDDEEALIADGVCLEPSLVLLQRLLDDVGPTLDEIGVDRLVAEAAVVPTATGSLEDPEPDTAAISGLKRDAGTWRHDGSFPTISGRRGEHSDDFDSLWDELTGLYRAHPGARW